MWISRKKYNRLKEELEEQKNHNKNLLEKVLEISDEKINTTDLIEENKTLKSRIKELYATLKAQEEIIDTLNAAHNEEIECNRSNSCRFCGYSAIVRTTCGEKCICTYGLCKHFKPAEEVRSEFPK